MIDAAEAFRQIEAVILHGLTHPSPASPSWEHVTNLDTAMKLAMEQCLEGYEDWCTLRELHASKSLGKAYEVDGDSRSLDIIWDLAQESAIPGLRLEIESEVGADLKWCSEALLFETPASEFFKQIVSAYASGYWPCGWKGTYPHGSLCVFPLRDAIGTKE